MTRQAPGGLVAGVLLVAITVGMLVNYCLLRAGAPDPVEPTPIVVTLAPLPTPIPAPTLEPTPTPREALIVMTPTTRAPTATTTEPTATTTETPRPATPTAAVQKG